MNTLSKALMIVALTCPAGVRAQPSSGRLDRATEFSQAAAGAGTLDQARALSATALEGSSKFEGGVVDASGYSGTSASKRPALTFAPARSLAAKVPSPMRSSSSGDNSHAGAFMIAGALSPLVGAVAGALLGGAPGAVIGALIGTAVGLVLFFVGAFRALRHVFNP